MAVVPPAELDLLDVGVVLDGRYRITGLLGGGGMARVYSAEHLGIARTVAVKVLHGTLAQDREASARFALEAVTSGRLDHPNIVMVTDSGVLHDGRLYLVMEALDGETLQARLRREVRIPWKEAVEIAKWIAMGLEHAHKRGVVHRDIKPDNIFLLRGGADPVLKILDFGVAKLRSTSADQARITRSGLTIGTPAYMSPEQAVDGDITPASDLYSLTAVLFELITGLGPFEREDVAATMRAHVNAKAPQLASIAPELAIPDELEALIALGLAKDPTERMKSAAHMVQLLDRVRFGGASDRTVPMGSPVGPPAVPEPEVEPNPPERKGRLLTSQRFMMLGLAVLAVAAVNLIVKRMRAPEGTVAQGVADAREAPRPTPAPAPVAQAPDPVVEAIAAAINAGRVTSPPGDNALERIRAAERTRPGDPAIIEQREIAVQYLVASAELLWQHGKQDSARVLYLDVLQFEPEHPLATERSRRDKPATAAAPRPVIDRSRIESLIAQIELAVIDRRFVAPRGHNALDYLVELRKLDPSNTTTSRLSREIATALDDLAKQKPDQATELLAAAERVREVKPPADGTLGAEEKKRVQEAVKQAVAKGNVALAAGQYAEATSAYQRAIAVDSTAHAALAGLADVAFNQGDFERAVLTAKRAVALAPRSAAYRMILAKSLYKIMRYEEAIQHWEKVLEIDLGNRTAAKNIEMAKAKLGR
ncbi:MAG: protein kinase [Deltaproteobacteria bacterium]|nr:protein kinase [Deltaproteobacteria bacterium]